MVEKTIVGYIRTELPIIQKEIKRLKKLLADIRKKEIETEMLSSGEKAILPKPKHKERIW